MAWRSSIDKLSVGSWMVWYMICLPGRWPDGISEQVLEIGGEGFIPLALPAIARLS